MLVTNVIGSMRTMTSLQLSSFYNTTMPGDISNLRTLTSLQHLSLYDTTVTADIGNLRTGFLGGLRTLTSQGRDQGGELLPGL